MTSIYWIVVVEIYRYCI